MNIHPTNIPGVFIDTKGHVVDMNGKALWWTPLEGKEGIVRIFRTKPKLSEPMASIDTLNVPDSDGPPPHELDIVIEVLHRKREKIQGILNENPDADDGHDKLENKLKSIVDGITTLEKVRAGHFCPE